LLVQDAAYLGTAVWFAAKRGRPAAWQFGLRPVPFVRAALLTLGAGLAVLGFELGYLELVGAEDDTEDLTSSGNAVAAVAVSLAVIVAAPVTEELFFRAFVYRALRNRLRLWPAALIDGLVFAAVHVQYLATPEVLLVIAVFGVSACLLYEVTGSVFPCIAVHAAFNTLALAGTSAGYAAPIAVGALVLLGCVLVPRMLAPAPSPLRP
jgi:membrane protease YdiL (CAAX protease family)